MRFERANGAFGDVAAIHVGQDQMEGILPVFSDESLEVGAEFVVHDMMVKLVALLPEALHDGVEIRDLMLVSAVSEEGL